MPSAQVTWKLTVEEANLVIESVEERCALLTDHAKTIHPGMNADDRKRRDLSRRKSVQLKKILDNINN
jgi:hypothetical protein